MYSDEILCTEYVQDKERDEALAVLNKLSYREKKKLVGITDDYYLDKILKGVIPMSGYIYFKIIPDKRYNATYRYCIRCGEKLCSLKNIYCKECDINRFSRYVVNNSSPDDSLVRIGIPFAIGRNRYPDSYGEQN